MLLGSAPGHGAATAAAAAATVAATYRVVGQPGVLQQLCTGALHPTSAQLAALAALGSAVAVPLGAQLVQTVKDSLLSRKARGCVAAWQDRGSMQLYGRPAVIGDLSNNPWALTALRVQHLIENPASGITNPKASQPAKSPAETKDYRVYKRSFSRLGLEVPTHKQFNLNQILTETAKTELATAIAEVHKQKLSERLDAAASRGSLSSSELVSSLKKMPAFEANFRQQVGAGPHGSVSVNAVFNSFAGWGNYAKIFPAETLRGEQLIEADRSNAEFHSDAGDGTGERYVCTLLGPPTLFVKNLPATQAAAAKGERYLNMVLNRIMPEDNEFTFVPEQQCAPTIVQKGGQGSVHYLHATPPQLDGPGPQNRLLLVIDVYN